MTKKSTFPLVTIQMQVRCCDECPKVIVHDTPGAGTASDYYCTMAAWSPTHPDPGRYIMGYVEWDRDKVPVPDWCPIAVGRDINKQAPVKEKLPLIDIED